MRLRPTGIACCARWVAAILLGSAALSACSDSEGPESQKPAGTSFSVTLSTPDAAGDTVYLRSSDITYYLELHAFVDSVPANGVNVTYFDPLTKMWMQVQSFGNGIAKIGLGVKGLTHDTVLNYTFVAYYGSSASTEFHKVVKALLSVAAPAAPRLLSGLPGQPADTTHVIAMWHREASDVFTDTLIVEGAADATTKYLVQPGDSSVVVGGLSMATLYKFTRHTEGGTSPTAKRSPMIPLGITRLYDILTPSIDSNQIVGLRFLPTIIQPLRVADRDSSDLFFTISNLGSVRGPQVGLQDLMFYVDGVPGRHQVSGYGAYFGTIDSSQAVAVYGGGKITLPSTASGTYVVLGSKLERTRNAFSLEVQPQPGGSYIGHDATGDYIEVRALYQPYGLLF